MIRRFLPVAATIILAASCGNGTPEAANIVENKSDDIVMKVDFETVAETVMPNFKGGEKEFAMKVVDDGLNKLMKGRLVPGGSIGYHLHDTNSEIMYITRGSGYAICDSVRIELHEGDVHYCPKGHSHTLVNNGDTDLEVFAVVARQ